MRMELHREYNNGNNNVVTGMSQRVEGEVLTPYREFIPINNNTRVTYDLYNLITECIPHEVNLPINYDELLPFDVTYNDVIPLGYTVLGGIEVRGKLDVNDDFVGVVNINITQTLIRSVDNNDMRHNESQNESQSESQIRGENGSNITIRCLNIVSSRANYRFNGRSCVQYSLTHIVNNGLPETEVHTENIDYTDDVLDGQYTVTDINSNGYNHTSTTSYVNGQIVVPEYN